jgi:regulator of cell morphogenesis and NO signaling
MKITEHTRVADIAAALPASVRIFQRHGIDFCCGGQTPLASACEERGVPFAAMVSAIEAASTTKDEDDRDWNREPLRSLIDHIVVAYHNALRAELPRLESMAHKVSRVHGAKAPHLLRVERIVTELSAELRAHMRKEEFVLFPAIHAMEAGEERPGVSISAPIAVMEDEHDHAGALLSELRTLTDGYVRPGWACETARALYQGLAELESEMHVHVHLENNILFPRALALSGVDRMLG